jgi:hypothetical protein
VFAGFGNCCRSLRTGAKTPIRSTRSMTSPGRNVSLPVAGTRERDESRHADSESEQ